MIDPAATLGMGAVVSGAVVWVAFFAREAWRQDRQPCLCGHPRHAHVSAFDWDSDYGDPQHVGQGYKKPGTCRECTCRHYIPERKVA